MFSLNTLNASYSLKYEMSEVSNLNQIKEILNNFQKINSIIKLFDTA